MALKRISRLSQKVYSHLRRQNPLRWATPSIDRNCPNKSGTLFIGYAEGALGLGQSFRSDLDAAMAVDMEFSIYPFRVHIETRLLPPYMPERYDQTHIYSVNVIELAADQLPFLYKTLNPALLKNSYNILRAYWELARAPDIWRRHLVAVDEIWAPNSFVAQSFEPIFNGPIKIVSPVVNVEACQSCTRSEFDMQDGRFYFLFSFDFFSSVHRKNPLAVLRAFRHAFPSGSENVGLVMKFTGSSERFPEFNRELLATKAVDSRIVVIDGHISREKMLRLIQATDAYMSLHRAEGFGLGMAEAMGLGKIVIGTDYSGNTDFLREETGFPVPFTMRPITPGEYPYSRNQLWAEPDVQMAADIMRHVVEKPECTVKRTMTGKRLILDQYSVNTVGEQMKERLAEIAANGGQKPKSPC